MLTRIIIRNFKLFEEVDIELGNSVVFIGPNNSGKTTALQALALWEIGLKKWIEKRKDKKATRKRIGVPINRYDLISLPTPSAKFLWHDLHVRHIFFSDDKQHTKNIRIDIIVEGITDGKIWTCGFEFDYANEQAFYCRPIKSNDENEINNLKIPKVACDVSVAFLPPMSGLASDEAKLEIGKIRVYIGEGRTAQVLRNLCYQIFDNSKDDWDKLVEHIKKLFGAEILPPQYIIERGEITMSYKEKGIELDISCSGRGLQQILLVLAHLYANPKTVLLIDEPDAHLEILRQRQIYQLLVETAKQKGSQIIVASHSEVLLNEAADRDLVVAFVGKPHRIDSKSQTLKSLKEIGFDQYLTAEQRGWILYLEGSTDLAILRTFAQKLEHEVAKFLECPFVHYVGNLPTAARDHFYGLKEAYPDLVGIAIFDNIEKELKDELGLKEIMWKRNEIENYLCIEEVLINYAAYGLKEGDIFDSHEAERRKEIMKKSIEKISSALKTLKKTDPWSDKIKASDDFLTPLFEKYFKNLNMPNLLNKTNFHILTDFIPIEKIDHEIKVKLDAIVEIAKRAKPRS